MHSLELEPKRDWRKIILLATPVAAIISGLLVAYFVFQINPFARNTKDPAIGKFAYSSKSGQYIGRVEDFKKDSNQYFIREPTGALIRLPEIYVEISDVKPGPVDATGRSYKSSSTKPPDN